MHSLEIKKGIKLHIIKTNKFKTNLISVFLTTKLSQNTITMNALIPAILRRGNSKLRTQEEISKALEEMYGASFDCGVDKIGNNQVIKFYLETINNRYIEDNEDNFKKALDLIFDIAFNPLTESGKFNRIYLENEKDNLRKVIEGRKDSKASYALERCIEEMYKNNPYALYKYGNIKDIEKIDEIKLYRQYLNLINNCKIDIYISGQKLEEVKEYIMSNENIKKLQERTPEFILNNIENRKKNKKQEQTIEESMDITQGKLVLGLDILDEKENDKYTALVYNAILGGTPNSKMFQNVREKKSLAYTASSSFLRQKANIFIRCGIEINNYKKAVKLIKEQIEDMKKGEFSEEDITQAKNNICSAIKMIPEEQDSELIYYFSQELSGNEMKYKEYINNINSVNKQKIIDLANKIQINTVYFLRN